MTGRPAPYRERSAAGRAERLTALRGAPGFAAVHTVCTRLCRSLRGSGVATDDVVDALLLIAAADRWRRGQRRQRYATLGWMEIGW